MSQQWSAPPAGVFLFPRGMDLRAGRVRRGRSVTGRWRSFRMTGKPPRERHRSKESLTGTMGTSWSTVPEAAEQVCRIIPGVFCPGVELSCLPGVPVLRVIVFGCTCLAHTLHMLPMHTLKYSPRTCL